MRGLTKVGGPRSRAGEAGGDRIERPSQPGRTGWDVVLVWFMRLVALFWLAKGGMTWAAILDVLPGAPPFGSEPVGRQAVLVYLAVIDFVAAVGLWLTSAWGGVVWLLAATSALTLAILTPQLLSIPRPLIVVQASTVALYFALSWLAAREIR